MPFASLRYGAPVDDNTHLGAQIAPYNRSHDETDTRVEAGVLVPLFRDDRRRLRLVLVARGPDGIHGGQVSLPGGRREANDASPRETAVRETHEEIGLEPNKIDVLAALEPIDTRTTGFRVYPFIARIEPPTEWKLSRGEISTVLTPTVDELADPHRREITTVSFPDWSEPQRTQSIVLEGGGVAIWGLTLRLLDRVLPRLLAGEWTI